MSRVLTLSLLSVLSACGSVELPREHFWRLDLPAPAGGALPRGGVLRVDDLQLGNSLSGDCLVRADGPLHLEQRELQRWIAPLDRLITDAVMLGLSRTRVFTLVKSAGDPGSADHTLHGRIVEFAEVAQGDRVVGRAALQFWVEGKDGIALATEIQSEAPLTDAAGAPATGPEAAVRALSTALQQVLDELVGRLQQAGLLSSVVDATPPGK